MANLGDVATLEAAVNAAIPDNTSNVVTPANVRTSIIDTIDTLVGVGVQPKVYKAILNQSGTSAPVATVLVNTLGGTVVWTRSLAGIYLGTLAAAFPLASTLVSSTVIANLADGNSVSVMSAGDGNTVQAASYMANVLSDDFLENFSVIIEVYP